MSLMTTQRHVIHPRDDVNIQQHVNIQQRDDTADKPAVSYSRQGAELLKYEMASAKLLMRRHESQIAGNSFHGNRHSSSIHSGKSSRTEVFYTRSEHHPVIYQESLHTAVSESTAAARTASEQSHQPSTSATSSSSSHRSKRRRSPISISQTPSTQTFDNTLVDFPAVTSSSNSANQRMRQAESANQRPRQADPVERHSLPDTVTSSSVDQRRRNEMLDYFAVRRPQVKWQRPVRLPPTNSERCLKSPAVYQSRSLTTRSTLSAHVMEKPQALKPTSDEVKPSTSAPTSQPSFNAGLARIIDRERRSYQELAAKTAAAEQLAAAAEQLASMSRLEVLQTTSSRMIDAWVQSDHAVDLLLDADRPPQASEELLRVKRPEKIDKATVTDDNWLQTSAISFAEVVTDELPTTETSDDPNTVMSDVAGELHDDTAKTETREDDTSKSVIPGRFASSGTVRRRSSLKVHWARLGDDDERGIAPLVSQPSRKFADELLLASPWAARSSVVELCEPCLERGKAVLARSDEHMVIMEADPSEEQSRDRAAATPDQSACDQVTTEGLSNDRDGHNSTETSLASHPGQVEPAATATSEDVTSAVQDGGHSSSLDDASAISRRNATNNMRMMAMSQRSLDEFERSRSSVSRTTNLSSQIAASSTVCSVCSGVTSCCRSDSEQLSTSTPRKINVTNNAMMLASVTGQQPFPRRDMQPIAVQPSQKAVTAPDLHSPSFTAFPEKPDAVMVDQLGAVWSSTFEPVFGGRTWNDAEVEASAETSNTQEQLLTDKPKRLAETNELSQTLKLAKVKTEKPSDRQDGTAHVSNTTNVSGKTISTIREHPEPRAPTAGNQKQTETVVSTLQATKNPASTINQATKEVDVTGEAAKKKRLEINLPLDTFTLHETVRELLENKGELNVFTLHGTVKRLLDSKKITGLRSKQTDTGRSAKDVTAAPRVRRISGDKDHQASAETKTKPSLAASVELQETNKATQTASLDKIDAQAQKGIDVKSGFPQSFANPVKEGAKTKLSTVSDSVPSQSEEMRKILRVTVEPVHASKNQEHSAGMKAKEHIRLEIVEDLPSPSHPEDQQKPSPSPSVDSYEHLSVSEQVSVTSVDDQPPPSTFLQDVAWDSDAMMALRRLFPEIGNLVRVTLVPPRRSRRARAVHEVSEDGMTQVPPRRSSLSLALHEDKEDAATPPDPPPQASGSLVVRDVVEDQVDETSSTSTLTVIDNAEQLSFQIFEDYSKTSVEETEVAALPLPRDDTASTGKPSEDKPSDDVADQFSPLPKPRPRLDDVTSLGRSSMTSSTDLPLDMEPSRHEFSDMQESLTKTLTRVPRVLPPYVTRAQQSYFEKAQISDGRGVKEELTNVNNHSNDDGADVLPENASATSACSIAGFGRRFSVHAALAAHGEGMQLGISEDDVEELVRRSPTPDELLTRDIDERAATIVSGIVQSLLSTSNITKH